MNTYGSVPVTANTREMGKLITCCSGAAGRRAGWGHCRDCAVAPGLSRGGSVRQAPVSRRAPQGSCGVPAGAARRWSELARVLHGPSAPAKELSPASAEYAAWIA